MLPLVLTRRQTIVPLAATLASTALPAEAHTTQAIAPSKPLPSRYDTPLGIGIETWTYPAPVHWLECTAGGQPVRMAYMDVAPTGKSRGKTAVLLHGKNFDSSYWSGPIDDLAAAGFRVIVPDQIGFNKSSKPDITYSFETLAGLTLQLLGSLQIGAAAFIGHSTGGMLSTRLAAAYPDKVERLVLEDPLGLIDYRRFIPAQTTDTLVAAERRQTVASYRAFLRGLLPILSPERLEPFVEWRMRVAHSGEYERFCKASALTYQMIYREPVRDQFQDIAAPTLMIVGARDASTPLKHYASPEMAARIPSIPDAAPGVVKDLRKGTLVTIPDVGHVPHLEAPDKFRDAVIGFLTA